MAKWESVSNNATDIKKMEGEPVIGEYTGKKSIVTKIGEQVIWQFNDEDGQPFGIYGFTNLNRAMEQVGVGSVLRITYKGTAKVQTKFGLKDVHQVNVERQIDETGGESGQEELPPVDD